MSFWSAVVVIVAILAWAWLRSERYRAVGRGGRSDQRQTDPERDRLEGEVADLKKRMAVLERILTDEHRSRSIADEIESLRDNR
jgi:hypothetical protein